VSASARPEALQADGAHADTALASPDDIAHWEEAPEVTANVYVVQPHSIALLAFGLQTTERPSCP
jgi:hypothetical protein